MKLYKQCSPTFGFLLSQTHSEWIFVTKTLKEIENNTERQCQLFGWLDLLLPLSYQDYFRSAL